MYCLPEMGLQPQIPINKSGCSVICQVSQGYEMTITRVQAQASTFVPVKQGTCTFATLRETNNPRQRKLGTHITEYRIRAIIRDLKSGDAFDGKHIPSTHTLIIFNPSFELFDINLSPSPPTLELLRCSCCSSVAVLLQMLSLIIRTIRYQSCNVIPHT